MKQLYLLLLFSVANICAVLAQAPNISYQTPNVYTLNTTIPALAPVNTGGAVPATIYGKVTILLIALPILPL